MVHTIGGDAGPCGDIDGIAGKNCAGVGIALDNEYIESAHVGVWEQERPEQPALAVVADRRISTVGGRIPGERGDSHARLKTDAAVRGHPDSQIRRGGHAQWVVRIRRDRRFVIAHTE